MPSISSHPVATVDRENSAEDSDDRSKQRADRARPGSLADQNADADADYEHGEENATGTSGAELRR